ILPTGRCREENPAEARIAHPPRSAQCDEHPPAWIFPQTTSIRTAIAATADQPSPPLPKCKARAPPIPRASAFPPASVALEPLCIPETRCDPAPVSGQREENPDAVPPWSHRSSHTPPGHISKSVDVRQCAWRQTCHSKGIRRGCPLP